MTSPFKIGDMVRCKIGGPVMIVDLIRKDGTAVQTVWFSGDLRQEGWFRNELVYFTDSTGLVMSRSL